MKKLFALLSVFALALVMLAGCGKKENNAAVTEAAEAAEAVEETLIDKIKAAGVMVVYCNPEFPPYEYLGDSGTTAGCEIDLINRVADRLGVKADIVSAEFDSILGTVQTGKADVGASGFTITPERKRMVSFSKPFDKSVQYIIVMPGSAIKTLDDLAGKRIGGQQGTTGALMCEDAINVGEIAGASFSNFNTAPDAVTAMKAGQLDAVIIDKLVAMSLANKNKLECMEAVFANGEGLGEIEEFGIMVAKGNECLLDVINEVIDEMAADGSYAASVLMHQTLTENM